MKISSRSFFFGASFLFLSLAPASAQITSFVNNGLVGVGEINANAVDTTGLDTIGGIFSAMAFNQNSLQVTTNSQGATVYSGTLYGQSDRGLNDEDTGSTTDFHGRLESFSISITPATGSPGAAGQIQLSNTATELYSDLKGNPLTGLDATSVSTTAANGIAGLPQSSTNNHISLDAEGLTLAPDGTTYTSDEYGPIVYHFGAAGQLVNVIIPPAAYTPITNGAVDYSAAADPTTSGRTANGGLEGLSFTPDGQYLVAALQRPLVQDGGSVENSNGKPIAENTRILQFYATGPKAGQLAHEYVYVLHTDGNDHGRATGLSELLALNDTQFLVLDRDSGGRGAANNNPPSYKEVVAVDTSTATDIAGTGFDQEGGTSGDVVLPTAALSPSGTNVSGFGTVVPLPEQPVVNLIDTTSTNHPQLTNFGQNASADWTHDKTSILSTDDTVPEKLEGMALIPEKNLASPNHFLLLVGSDNDYINQGNILENGSQVAGLNDSTENGGETDNTKIYAYDVTLPGASVLIPPLPPETDTPVMPVWGLAGLAGLLLLAALRNIRSSTGSLSS
jgi:hypothetical protein